MKTLFFLAFLLFMSNCYADCLYNQVADVSPFGDKLILEDGSLWKPSQGDDAWGWTEGDNVIVCRDRHMINIDEQDDQISVIRVE